jgi:hypothetical protein
VSEDLKDEIRSSEYDFELSQTNDMNLGTKLNQSNVLPSFFPKVNHNQLVSQLAKRRQLSANHSLH